MSLEAAGLTYKFTRLGQPIFIKTAHAEDNFCNMGTNSLSPTEWTPKQLRAMADHMEKHPNCSLFTDGSGKLVDNG